MNYLESWVGMVKNKFTKELESKPESKPKLEQENVESGSQDNPSENEGKESRKKKTGKKQVLVSARRKMAIARASIKPGKGRISINKLSLTAIENPYVKTLIQEPLKIANDYVSQVDIDVIVKGGGQMGQAQAVRSAIAKALVAFTKDSQLKKEMLAYDRFMLVDDVRQVEPKKFKGRKARARFQKSYR